MSKSLLLILIERLWGFSMDNVNKYAVEDFNELTGKKYTEEQFKDYIINIISYDINNKDSRIAIYCYYANYFLKDKN